jgi:hypothetical protein
MRIYASLNLIDVHHARNLLESAGIRTELRNESLASAIGQLPFTECQPELWLLSGEDFERAQRLLADGPLAPGEKGNGWQCECGELQEAQFTQCWKCAKFRPR